jgi:hypothetical protein
MKYRLLAGCAFLSLICGMSTIASAAFDNPSYIYTKIYDVPIGVRTSEAQFSPDGTKILWGESLSDWSQMSVKYGDWNPATKTITNITTAASAVNGNYAYNAKWSPDGSYIGYITAGPTGPSAVQRYKVSDGTSSALYVPASGLDVANFDFYGNNDSIVFWDPTATADLFTYNGTIRSQLTNTAGITEYEPRTFGADAGKVLYWSGEGSAEANRVVAVLNTGNGTIETVVTGTTGQGLGPYWAVWGKNQSYVGVVNQITSGTDLLLYKRNPDGTWAYADDLTGAGYSGGDWNFFGSFLSDGSFCFESQVGGEGRDIWYAGAVPEPTTIIVWTLLGLTAVAYRVWRRKRAA